MKNIEISNIFSNIAELLQVRGDASYRIQSYVKAARVIADLTVDVSELIESGKFQNIQGIGKTTEEKTKDILETGTCKAYQELIDEMGLGVLELLDIQGVGAKTVNRLYYEHDITNLDQLANAIEDGSLQSIKGFGKKTLETITKSLVFVTTNRCTRLISISNAFAERLSSILNSCSAIKGHVFTGDLRRREEESRSLEVVVECGEDIDSTESMICQILTKHKYQIIPKQASDVQEQSLKTPLLDQIPTIHLNIDNGFPVIIYLSTAVDFESILFLTTSSEEHLIALSTNTPLSLSTSNDSQRYWEETKNQNEIQIHKKLGIAYIPPEQRQFSDSVVLALEDKLPSLLDFNDMRGDLHSHTEWSDGRNTMDEMVASAKILGMEYFAITDHSVSSSVANGLDQNRLLDQIKHVREKDAATDDINLLAGSEVDIRRDGTLDFSDEILIQLDIVIASIHSHFTLSESEMTKRMLCAIENPYVNIIGHPTGRLLGSRPSYPINMDEIITAAAEHNKILEINGSPNRLDLGPEYVRKAKTVGILFSINTDAHSRQQFERREYGINVARRSGLTKDDVINTYPIDRLRETLRKNTQ